MSYVSSIDNKTFSSKEEAIKYFEENYLFEEKNENIMTDIIEAVKSVISEGHGIEVKLDNENYYVITVKNDLYTINGHLMFKDDSEQSGYWGSEYNSIEDISNYFKYTTKTVEEILKRVHEDYDFKEFKFERYHDDYGNGNYFDFSYITQEEENFQVTYDGYDLDSFIEQFKQHFVDFVEGSTCRINEDGYFIDYEIDNVPINGLLRRANALNKKVRLEIVD